MNRGAYRARSVKGWAAPHADRDGMADQPDPKFLGLSGTASGTTLRADLGGTDLARCMSQEKGRVVSP